MTDITYTYEVISVDEAARCMEVVYTSEKHGVMHVGARLPFEGETVEDIVRMFSPVAEWRTRELKTIVPPVGASGKLVDLGPTVAVGATDASATWSEAEQAAFNAAIESETLEFGGAAV